MAYEEQRLLLNILCFVDRAYVYNTVNRTNLVHNFLNMFYCFSLRVSGNYVPMRHLVFVTLYT